MKEITSSNDRELDKLVAETQKYICSKFSDLIVGEDKAMLLSKVISFLHTKNNIHNIEIVAQEIVNEMANFSFLSKYLDENRTDIEEINITQWDNINISYSDGRMVPCPEKFTNSQHAVDVIKKLLQQSNMTWDKTACAALGYLRHNVRITAVGYDLVDVEQALVVNIRIINPKKFEKTDFIKNKTATEDMLDFISNAFNYGASIGVSGSPGCGKTTLMSWLLSKQPEKKRIFTIEKSREFNCVKKDENGNVINNACHFVTRPREEEKYNYTEEQIMEVILTMNPDVIALAETKGHEAMITVTAANTGTTVITTAHANSTNLFYSRLQTLCSLKYQINDNTLRELVSTAFPIAVYCRKFENNERKIVEISERVISEKGHFMNVLYQYKLSYEDDATSKGLFVKVNSPSDNLKTLLFNNGMPINLIHKYFDIKNIQCPDGEN